MKVVIMAGGQGTRIRDINSEVPKPMIPILNKPILEYQLEVLRKQNLTNIIIVIGYKGEVIQQYFQDGFNFGVHIEYIVESEPLGTAGALYLLKDKINEDFLLINGDIIFDVDISRFYKRHREKEAVATILTHPNDHPYDSGIIATDENGKVINWFHKEDKRNWYKNRVNAGLHLLSPEIFESLYSLKKLDLDRDVLKPLITQGKLYSYDSPEYVKDMGTPKRYEEVIRDIKVGKVQKKNLMNKQKAVFLDRDGTINKYVGFLTNIEQFELVDGIVEFIKQINESGYLAIVITNQPVVARGEITIQQLQEIHNKMETLLGEKGVYVDDIFFCPHHPDRGFSGERIEYKIDCNCRKPKPGLLIEAAEKYNIDLSNSYMIGDSESDILAGKSVGCRTIKIEVNNISEVEIKLL